MTEPTPLGQSNTGRIELPDGKIYVLTQTLTLSPRESVEHALERAIAAGKAYEVEGRHS